jgi:hypothetical protein
VGFHQKHVAAESKRELCQVPGVPLDQDAGAHLQDLGQHARRGEMTQQSQDLPPNATCPFIWLANLQFTAAPLFVPISNPTFQLSPQVLTMLMPVLWFYSLLTLQLASCTFHVPALC